MTRQAWLNVRTHAPHLETQTRQVVARLELLSHGSTTAWDSSSGVPGSRPPTGESLPPHLQVLGRLAGADSEAGVAAVVKWAENTLEAARRQPSVKVQGESAKQREARIVKDGEGWSISDVCQALRVAPSEVKRARLHAGRYVSDGRPLGDGVSVGKARAVLELRRRGWRQKAIGEELGLSQASVSRLLNPKGKAA